MRLPILLLLLFGTRCASAQPQYGNWYFGFGGGISFIGGAASALSDNPFTTDEGSATISDASGQLLFTTNGQVVYDRYGAAMPNGSALGGHSSAAQSALIVPVVGDPDRYYVFTVPAQLGTWAGLYNGLSYSVVNMTLNGGAGDVEVANVHLVDEVTEHLTACRHANGRDVWVVCHGWDSDVYHVFLVSCEGIQGPFDSHAGRLIGQDPADTHYAAIGCMDIASNGGRLACTWTDYDVTTGGTARLDVLSFDPATGTVGPGTGIDHGGSTTSDLRGYGVSFSPNGTRLYWSENGLLGGIAYSGLLQFDLLAPDLAASEQLIATVSDAFGTLQNGPDGHLYCARLNGTTHISRVMLPDALGAACGFDELGVSIAPAISTWGLSNDWDTFPTQAPLPPLVLNDTTICSGTDYLADATYIADGETPTYMWSTGATTPTIMITAPGTYSVTVGLSCGQEVSATFEVAFGGIPVDLGPDQLLCIGDSLALAVDPGEVAEQVFWNTGERTRTITVKSEGPVWVDVWDGTGCTNSDTLVVDLMDCTCPVYLPNTFTPNGDAINDEFRAQGDCLFEGYRLTVFDRWGHELFATDEPGQGWMGEGIPVGVYAYALDYAWSDGEESRRAVRRGHVTLLR